jgi:hypothetical protein
MIPIDLMNNLEIRTNGPNTRNRDKPIVPADKLEIRRARPDYMVHEQWNILPESYKQIDNIKVFRRDITQYLLQKQNPLL